MIKAGCSQRSEGCTNQSRWIEASESYGHFNGLSNCPLPNHDARGRWFRSVWSHHGTPRHTASPGLVGTRLPRWGKTASPAGVERALEDGSTRAGAESTTTCRTDAIHGIEAGHRADQSCTVADQMACLHSQAGPLAVLNEKSLLRVDVGSAGLFERVAGWVSCQHAEAGSRQKTAGGFRLGPDYTANMMPDQSHVSRHSMIGVVKRCG